MPFLFQNIELLFLLLYFALKQNKEKVLIFWQNHGLTPLEKCKD